MDFRLIKNAAGSMNNYFNTTVKNAMEADTGRDLCFFFKTSDKLSYPSVQLRIYNNHFDNTRMQFGASIEMYIRVNRDEEDLAWLMQGSFYVVTGFSDLNVNRKKIVDLNDWSDKRNPVKIGCIELIDPSDSSFVDMSKLNDEAYNFRKDMRMYYK